MQQSCIFNVSTAQEPLMPTVQTWGNSLAVRIPAALANQLSVTSGSEVNLSVSNGALLVKPATRRKYRLSELLKDCRPKQLHGEVDFGADVGREVID